jgi:hypothetical protein
MEGQAEGGDQQLAQCPAPAEKGGLSPEAWGQACTWQSSIGAGRRVSMDPQCRPLAPPQQPCLLPTSCNFWSQATSKQEFKFQSHHLQLCDGDKSLPGLGLSSSLRQMGT